MHEPRRYVDDVALTTLHSASGRAGAAARECTEPAADAHLVARTIADVIDDCDFNDDDDVDDDNSGAAQRRRARTAAAGSMDDR